MPNIRFNCMYCDHFFSDYLYSVDDVEKTVCPVCKDGNLKVLDSSKGDTFGYSYDEAKPDAYIRKKK
jgi:Zn finger protein HypA/HybF involved in hydrogenase expression